MVFSSPTFLFFFLPIALSLVVAAHCALNKFTSKRTTTLVINCILLSASLLFYYWGEGNRIWILALTTLSTFIAGIAIAQLQKRNRLLNSRVALWLGIGINLGFLLWYKYAHFASTTISRGFETLGTSGFDPIRQIALPLGISFYTFQLISYLLDVYWRRTSASPSLIDFSCYITFFPQLVAGPVVRYDQIREELQHRKIDWSLAASGLHRFIIGLGKKVLIANPVGKASDDLFATPIDQLSTAGCWLACVSYAIQILFDFSGYSDMAIGLGRIFGIEIPENFRSPYKQRSIRAFWRNWHISLSTWFRDYLYIPLGGSKKSRTRTSINLIIVFIACGLWHGADTTFIAWGLYHGLFLATEHCIIKYTSFRPLRRLKLLGQGYTIVVVFLGWVLFRCATLEDAAQFYRYMLIEVEHLDYKNLPLSAFSIEYQLALLCGLALSTLPVPNLLTDRPTQQHSLARISNTILSIILLLLSAIYISISSHNPFIYFRF